MTEPNNKTAARFSLQGIVGVALLIAAVIVRRVFAIAPGDTSADALADAAMGGDIADLLIAFGASLGAFAPPLPSPKRPPGSSGGSPGAGIITGIVLSAIAMLAPGCATLTDALPPPHFRRLDWTIDPHGERGCAVTFIGDGRQVGAFTADWCRPKDPDEGRPNPPSIRSPHGVTADDASTLPPGDPP